MSKYIKQGVDLQPRQVICRKCGFASGTLVKVAPNEYAHDRCPVVDRKIARLLWRVGL